MINKKYLIIVLLLFTTSCSSELKNNKEDIKTQNFNEKFFAQISVEDFKKELENPEVTLIDVRTPGEIPVYGKIRENQLLINSNDVNSIELINKLDKSKKYAIYCWHGNRSANIRKYMQENGFSYVKDLAGGIDGWTKAGESVIK